MKHLRNLDIFTLASRSLIFYFPNHVAVLLAAATVTAVLTGALIMGDSLRHSLRERAVERLGKIDDVLNAPYLFRQSLADEIVETEKLKRLFAQAAPVLLVQTGVEKPDSNATTVNHVQLIGCDYRFWALGNSTTPQIPKARQIVLNRTLADLLNAKVGDRLILRVPQLQGIPSESSLGRRHALVNSSAVTVIDIIPDAGLGSFGLNLSQGTPRNAFVNLEWLSSATGQPGRASLLLLERANKSQQRQNVIESAMANLFLSPEDYGVRVERTPLGYLNLTTERLIFDPRIEELIVQRLQDLSIERVMISLAETVRAGDKDVWYVTMAALPLAPNSPLGSFRSLDGHEVSQPALEECIINEWLATRLSIRPGDSIDVTWFTPETRNSQVERQQARLRVIEIVAMEGAANDPALVPEVQGLTDKASIADWDPPFPFDSSRVTKADEEYWKQYRATPKIFVSPEFAAKHWTSRFGSTTSIRVVPAAGVDVPELRQRLRLSLAELGWPLQPIRTMSLEAAKGTTPFEWLFLGFSLFLLAAAIILTGLIFALTIQRRAVHIGIVRAVGWPPGRVFRWLITEALQLASLAALVGTVAGLGYAYLMLWGLHHLWLPAIGTRFLTFSFAPSSILLGFGFGLASGLLATMGVIVRLSRRAPRALLGGQTVADTKWKNLESSHKLWFLLGSTIGLLFTAAILAVWGIIHQAQSQAEVFFLCGALLLITFWLVLKLLLYAMQRWRMGMNNSVTMAMKNLSRNPGRTELTALLMAAAVFLIVSISAFYVHPGQLFPSHNSGNGGFAIIGETDLPVFDDLNDAGVQERFGFSQQERSFLKDARVFAFRVKSGEDASCLNLYRPRSPTVIGISKAFIERGGFAFTTHRRSDGLSNPWLLLREPMRALEDNRILMPAIIDDATAKYSMHLWKGAGDRFEMKTEDGRTIVFEIVGLLKDSIFQGKVLISEEAFLQLFPDASGYRLFLVEVPGRSGEQPEEQRKLWRTLTAAFERALSDEGTTFVTTQDRLATLFAVQNTYLSALQTLGGLGILLGTVGLGAVLFRGLWERRQEISLLRAVGFTTGRLQQLVILENISLLIAGLIMGTSAALAAIFPQLFQGRALIPWKSLLGLLGAMIILALLMAWLATRWIIRQNLIAGLRRE
ncbi:MAG: FtsX-like permease family protein [Thermogutta sp.]